MALTADREYGCINPDDFVEGVGGAADTLYKGAIVSFGTNGLVKVAANVAAEVPMGLMKKQVVCAGANAEKIEIDCGKIAVEKKSVQIATMIPGTGGSSNVNYDGVYAIISNSTTKYCVWFNVNSGSTDPTIATPSLGTGVEVAVGTGDNAATVGASLASAIDALDDIGAAGTTTVTITSGIRGALYCEWDDGTAATVCPLLITVHGFAHQSDVGKIMYAVADDGVVLPAAKGSATIALGRCFGLVGKNNELWVNTHEKA